MDAKEFSEEWNKSHLLSPSYQDAIDWAINRMGGNDKAAPGCDDSQDHSEGWVNIYDGEFLSGTIYKTKEEAEKHCDKDGNYATVKIKMRNWHNI